MNQNGYDGRVQRLCVDGCRALKWAAHCAMAVSQVAQAILRGLDDGIRGVDAQDCRSVPESLPVRITR